jgi:hypothetical protein
VIAMRELPVAKSKKPVRAGKRRTHQDRKGVYAQVQLFRDLAEWLADIAAHETRRLKVSGDLTGYDKASVAKIVDSHLREWAWQRLSRINNAKAGLPPGHPIPPTPKPPEEPVELE